jgi:hypothetical protein
LILSRVLILKYPFELVRTGITKAIGAPEDYLKNQKNNNFPTTTDLRLPVSSSSGMLSSETSQIEVALLGMDLSDHESGKKKIKGIEQEPRLPSITADAD